MYHNALLLIVCTLNTTAVYGVLSLKMHTVQVFTRPRLAFFAAFQQKHYLLSVINQ